MNWQTYTLEEGRFPSSRAGEEIAYYIHRPICETLAVIQVVHGMCEHIGRYEEFAHHMAKYGIAVCGHDCLGHGKTARSSEELGFFGSEGGVDLLLGDISKMREITMKEFSGLPVIILGHSMGSFLTRLYLSRNPSDYSGAIISGTAGFNMPAGAGKILARIISALRGERHRSKLLYSLSIGSYSKKFPKGSPALLWLSGDENIRNAYEKDEFCTFRFTSRAYCDLFDVLSKISKKDMAKKMPKDIPIMLLSGDQDPVGNFGKGVTALYCSYLDAGMGNVTLKLYEGGHHEMLNELCRYKVYADLIAWIEYFELGRREEAL
ncbi:MAG: alpha/beta hydrolase [Ruminococcaceae bacterium]|nr:alpha/beta hydrolase [Oscillospiraceae bacterium]